MHVLSITATCGRHMLMERSLGFFLQQDYKDQHTLLIYNNSKIAQLLPKDLQLPENKHIILINQYIDSSTNTPYTSLGAIYNDILSYIPEDIDVVTHSDDDDIFLPNHISEGVAGLKKHQKLGYKPKYSFYRSSEGISLTENTLEPSIFVDVTHLKTWKYSSTTTEQHLQWVNPLRNENKLAVDPSGISTLCYNWGDIGIRCFKTSGDYHNPDNFDNYRTNSIDHGDGTITPWTLKDLEPYYKEINNGKS